MPTADSDGNAWIIAESGYAPAGGWPSYVQLVGSLSRVLDR